jgi:hypothetical protein
VGRALQVTKKSDAASARPVSSMAKRTAAVGPEPSASRTGSPVETANGQLLGQAGNDTLDGRGALAALPFAEVVPGRALGADAFWIV